MSRLAGTALASLLLATFAPSSNATPSFIYGFFVESYECGTISYPEPCWEGEEERGTRYLETLSITLSIDAIRDGTASFVLRTGGLQDPYTANDGVLSLGGRTAHSREPYQWFDATDPPLDPYSAFWWVDVDLDVGHWLRGAYSVHTWDEDIQMVSGASTLWSGYLASDLLLTGTYTGYWGLVQVVPEPSTLAVLGLGLAGLAFTRRRKQ